MKKLFVFILLTTLGINSEKDPVIYKSHLIYKPVNGNVTKIKEMYSTVDERGKLGKPYLEMVCSLDKYHRVTASYMRNLTIEPYDTSGRRKTFFNEDNLIDSVVFDETGYYRTVMKITYLEGNAMKTVTLNRKGLKEHETHETYDEKGRPLKAGTTWYNEAGEILKEAEDKFIYKNNRFEPASHTTVYYDANTRLTKKEKRVFIYGKHQEIIETKVYDEKDSLVQTLRFDQVLDEQHNPIKTTTYVNGELNMVVEREFTYKE